VPILRMSRRRFLAAAGSLAAGSVAFWLVGADRSKKDEARKKESPLNIGAIGVGIRGSAIAAAARAFGPVAAVCDVDRSHAERGQATLGEDEADVYSDYRRVLDRQDIQVVTIATPDHWHAKIAIEAVQAGKDVYCEKPLSLTIEEGKLICKAVAASGRVFQVGTQQRSEYDGRFLTAVALCHAGRLGKLQRITCAIGGGNSGGPFTPTDPPEDLDWDAWLGQARKVPYIKERCHYSFRWWYEYSGGKLTDWGAHHLDIAQWAMNATDTGPLRVEGTGTLPAIENGYNTATAFRVKCLFQNGVELIVLHDTENGIRIEGDRGEIFVNRNVLTGKPADELKDNPLPHDALTKLYRGKKSGNHMVNFFECVRSREQPISDVFSHHRSLTTCHLANIALRLGRPIAWDPAREEIVGDEEARGMQMREQRKGYEVRL
jgi:predicted dehydrogenase